MVRPARFEVTETSSSPTPALSVAGELDMNTAEVLAEYIERYLVNGVTALTIDLRRLEFMDSSGLRLLIDLHDRSRHEAWRLTLISPVHEAATTVLRVTGADTALPFEPGAPA